MGRFMSGLYRGKDLHKICMSNVLSALLKTILLGLDFELRLS